MCGGNGNQEKPIKITLTVTDAENLYNANPQPSTQAELDTYCSLADDNTTSPGKIPDGGTLNDFTSEVYAGNTVSWTGNNAGSNGYRVIINSITNNPNFFSSEPSGSGLVTATLRSDIDGKQDTYTINFSVDPPGNDEAKTYNLDPKLSGKPN